jgi:hypothetical protein
VNDRERARDEIQRMWDRSLDAMRRKDLRARLAIFDPSYHATLPDGTTQDLAAMERYIQQQHETIVDVDPATVVRVTNVSLDGDRATVGTHQRFIRRLRRPDGTIVEQRNWATHREEWIHRPDGWRYLRADVLEQGRIDEEGVER